MVRSQQKGYNNYKEVMKAKQRYYVIVYQLSSCIIWESLSVFL